jgi:antitoxin component YwqK of YwqJK toxin-antitoxin module
MSVGYKKCQDDRIVKLMVQGEHNEDRVDIFDKDYARMRCSMLRVLEITDMHDPSIKYDNAIGLNCDSHTCDFGLNENEPIVYRVGEIVESTEGFDADINEVYGAGITYFLTIKVAYFQEYVPKNGEYQMWHNNGCMIYKCRYKNGKKDGLCEQWYDNGQIMVRYTLVDGEYYGPSEKYFKTGQKHIVCIYKGELYDGAYERWHDNGRMRIRCTYIEGEKDGPGEEWDENGHILKQCTYEHGHEK